MVSVKRRHEESSFKRAAFFVSSFVFPEYRRNRSLLDGAEKTKINKNRRKYMEDTKKTVLAGNGEKDVPRAVYDGVLTIDVDAQVESMEEQEEARWHQLLNAHRTRKILTGQLGGIEKLESTYVTCERSIFTIFSVFVAYSCTAERFVFISISLDRYVYSL